MSEMVERVARAMCEAADDNWDWSVFYIVDANDTAETGHDVYRDMARAAIEAMKIKACPSCEKKVIDEAGDE